MTTRSMAARQFGRFGGSTCAITPPDDNSSSAFRPAADGIGSLRRFGPEALPARSAGCPILGGCAPGDNAPRIPGWPSARILLRTGFQDLQEFRSEQRIPVMNQISLTDQEAFRSVT